MTKQTDAEENINTENKAKPDWSILENMPSFEMPHVVEQEEMPATDTSYEVELYRKGAIGHIALTNDLVKSAKPSLTTQTAEPVTRTLNLHEPSDESLCQGFLHVIGENAEVMNTFFESEEIIFFENLAKIFRDRIDALEFPFFAAELFLLLRSWSEEDYSAELIEQFYSQRLVGVIREYARA